MMKSLRIRKVDIEFSWLKKLNSLPIKYYVETPHDFNIIVDDDFDDNLLGVECDDLLKQNKQRKLDYKNKQKG